MSKYIGPVCKLCRREGMKLFIKGSRCLTKEKCSLERRKNPPGEIPKRRPKLTDYAIQLREKQKVKRIYNVREKQFRIYYDIAARAKGMTGENLLQILERRLDNAVYKMGIASSRAQARNFIAHGHILLNGRRVRVCSQLVKVEDVVSIYPKFASSGMLEENIEFAKSANALPVWIEMDYQNRIAKINALPLRENVDLNIKEHIIVELYSK